MNVPCRPERHDVLDPWSRHPGVHQAGRFFGQNYLAVRRDMIAVRMRDEGEPLWIPRIEPQILRRQINAPFVSNFNHLLTYARKPRPPNPCSRISAACFAAAALIKTSKPAPTARFNSSLGQRPRNLGE